MARRIWLLCFTAVLKKGSVVRFESTCRQFRGAIARAELHFATIMQLQRQKFRIAISELFKKNDVLHKRIAKYVELTELARGRN